MVGPKYYSTTAVVLCEVFKFIACVLIYCASEKQNHSLSFSKVVRDVYSKDFWKLCIPAVLYTIQNNLQYTAASTLDVATFQVSYQMKILTTAVFSVIILHRSLSKVKWISLVILTLGIALVQFPSSSKQQNSAERDPVVGLLSVGGACITSGLAGVYFEKILKGSATSLWIRNIQLSLLSIVPGLFFGVYMIDGEKVSENGFFYGYNVITWLAIFTQAIGGLIVALVVKYADNILKGFATSLSIILSSIASIFIFNFEVTWLFTIGAAFVIYATYLYGLPDPTPPAKHTESEQSLFEIKVLTTKDVKEAAS